MTPGTRRLVTAALFALVLAAPIAALTPDAQAPTWPAQPTRDNQEGDELEPGPRFNITGHVDGQVSYSSSSLPNGLTIDAVTGVVSGTLRTSAADTVNDNGSAGAHTVTITAVTAGGSSSTQFTWRVSRFRKGDLFAGIGLGRYQVFDENGNYKYTVASETEAEYVASGTGGYGTTTGCAYNWLTRKMYFTSFDVDHDPHVIEVDPVPASADVSTAFPRNRISTFRDSGLEKGQPASGRAIDIAPESVIFGVQMSVGDDGVANTDDDFVSAGAGPDNILGNADDVRVSATAAPVGKMYVGHAGGYYNADWWPADSSERQLITSGEGISLVYVDADGNPLLSGPPDTPKVPVTFPQGVSKSGVLERWPGEPFPDSPVALIPWGRDLQEFVFSGAGTPSRVASHDTQTSWQGTDWMDLAADQRTIFYTSEWGVVYRYDVGPNPTDGVRQLPDYATLPPANSASQTLYALRLLPPGDGTGGLLVATPVALLRLNDEGRVLTQYDMPGVDGWFALNISPDGKSVWSASTTNARIYKFDIASGRALPLGANSLNGIQTNADPALLDGNGQPIRYSLDGLCVMGEYTAAQEICGNMVDDDGDGEIDELCQPIEACSNSSPGDDDGDGLVDSNDPDCGAVDICAAGGAATDPDIAGYCARHNFEGDALTVEPAPGPTDPNVSETYTVTGVEISTGQAGLPPGITFNGNAVATKTANYAVVSNKSAITTRTWQITVAARRTLQSDGSVLADYTHAFNWTIENQNQPPVATPHVRTTRPAVPVTVNVLAADPTGLGTAAADSDADADTISIAANGTAFTQPANGTVVQTSSGVFTYTPAANFVGADSFTYTITDAPHDPGPTVALTATATVTITVVNNPPVARDDTAATRPGKPVAIAALGNDSDADPTDVLTVTGNTQPAHGTVSWNATTREFTYTPTFPYVGSDSFEYTISDGFGGSDTAIVRITITNLKPDARDDFANTRPGTPTPIPSLSNDVDPDNDPLTVSSFNATSIRGGSVTLDADGRGFTYTSTPGHVGFDSFEYTITDGFGGFDLAVVRITSINTPPVAVDDAGTIRPGQTIGVAVLTNDTDADNSPDVAPAGPDPMRITGFTQPAHGSVTQSGTTLTYTHSMTAPVFVGVDTFTYTITDDFGGTDTATVRITIVNTPPVALDDSATTRPGQAVSIPVLSNDTDADPTDVLTVTGNTQPAHGTVQVSGNVFTYTPNAGYVGADSFEYTISDGFGGTDTAVVRITSNNSPPVALDDAATTRPGVAVSISVLSNDTDADSDTLDVTVYTTPANGTVSLTESTNVFTYTPNAGYVGADSFEYTIADGFGGTDTAVVRITSNNSPPVAVDDADSMIAGGPPVTIAVRANDPADPDGDTVTITAFAQPAQGSVVRSGDSFTFTPAAGFSGVATFTYTIADGFGGTSTATVTITVVNQPPVAVNDTATTAGTQPVTIAVMANDSDPDNHVISVTGATTPANGSAVVNANGTITYTANEGFQGTDTFFYTIRDGFGGTSTARVTITAGPPNRFDPCVCATAKASPAQIWPPNHKQTQVVNVTNLTDPDGGPLTIKILGIYQDEPTNYLGDGDTTIDAGGVGTSSAWVRAERTGNPNVPGNGRVYEIVFEATAQDGSRCQGSIFTGVPHDQGQGNYIYDDGIRYDSTVAGGPIVRNALKIEGGLTDADVTAREFTPTYVAEARIGGSGATREMFLGPASDPDADTEHFNWTSGQEVFFLLWRTGSTVTFKLLTSTQFEFVSGSISCPNGECSDIFIRAETGGTGKITLSRLNINGLAVPDTLTVADGGAPASLHLSGLSMDEGMLLGGLVKIEWIGTRPADAAVNFKILVGTACPTDGGAGGGGLGTPPLARTDTYATQEDVALIVSAGDGVLQNDLTFAGGLSASLVDSTTNGSISLNANGSFTYTPNAGFNGQDTFRYRVNDGSLYSEPALVTIQVVPVIDPPTAVDDSATTNERVPVTIAVLGNDSDAGGGAVTLASMTQPSHGTAAASGSGIVYTPAAGFIGLDTFTYTVQGAEGTATAKVTVNVVNVNEPPVAANDAYTTQEDTPLTISASGVKANDSDPDSGDTFAAALVTGPGNGTVALNANGSFTYTPAADFSGTDTFSYRVIDAGGLESAVATVTVTVTAVNDPPAAVSDSYVVSEDGALQINAPGVRANDSDPDTAVENLTITLMSGVQRGTLTLNADGSFLYSPLPNVSGSDSFVYQITDGTGTATATATIAITEVNDPPSAADDAATTTEDSAVTIQVLPNDSDPDGSSLTLQAVTQGANGTVAIAGNQVRYTPAANFSGTDTFSYTISDGTATASAKVVVTVTAVNDPPVAAPDTYTTPQGTPLNVQPRGVLANDTDPDQGQNLSAQLVSQASHGTVTLQTNGGFAYNPEEDFTGTDTFTYKVTDSGGESQPVTVTITVTAANRPPVAVNDTYSTGRNAPLTIAAPGVLQNDSDPDQGNTLTVTLISGTAATAGTVSVNPNGSFTFTPAQDFTGQASFRYRAVDNHTAQSNEAIATITVDDSNQPPVASDDSYTTDKGTPLTVAAPGVLGDDSDPDAGDTITATLVSGPPASAGTLTLDANGGFTFTPADDYTGTTTFRYRARDNHDADSGDATVTIEVKNPTTSGQVCYDGGPGRTQYRAFVDWNVLESGDVRVRATVSRNYADNTYGVNRIGWSTPHTFRHLYTSDYGRLAFYDSTGSKRMDFSIDYLSPLSGTVSGYGGRGVAGGPQADGGMVSGSASDIVSMSTSIDLNMNAFGYLNGSSNHPLKTYSPPTNASYAVNATYPLWIWDVWYEATVKGSVFGSAGFGYPRLAGLHASPAKTEISSWRMISCQ